MKLNILDCLHNQKLLNVFEKPMQLLSKIWSNLLINYRQLVDRLSGHLHKLLTGQTLSLKVNSIEKRRPRTILTNIHFDVGVEKVPEYMGTNVRSWGAYKRARVTLGTRLGWKTQMEEIVLAFHQGLLNVISTLLEQETKLCDIPLQNNSLE